MRNLRKTRGVIDPYTLGILISLIGGLAVYLVHKDDIPSTEQTGVEPNPTELVVIAPSDIDADEENP